MWPYSNFLSSWEAWKTRRFLSHQINRASCPLSLNTPRWLAIPLLPKVQKELEHLKGMGVMSRIEQATSVSRHGDCAETRWSRKNLHLRHSYKRGTFYQQSSRILTPTIFSDYPWQKVRVYPTTYLL